MSASLRLYEPDDEELPVVHPHVVAANQVADAMRELDRHPDAYLRWPFPALDEITGPLGAGGTLWFVCAYSGAGKTTFVASCIERWRAAGKRLYVMPLETRANTFRTYLACMAAGVHPGDALSGELRRMPNGEAMREAIKAKLLEQAKRPYADQVMISEVPAVNVHGLKTGLKEAKAFGADVVIVDHIDHLDGGAETSLYQASKSVNHAALNMAQDNGLTLLFTSQLNTQTVIGTDHLARFQPPRDQHVLFGNLKRQVATGMIGLFRKLRDRHETETDAEYLEAIKSARAGTLEAPQILDPGIMGVNAMKLRHYGAREGARVYLGFERGRVTDLNERDKYTTKRT